MFKKLVGLLIIALEMTGSAQELSKEALLDFVNTRYQAYFHYNMCTFKNLNSTTRHGRSNGQEPLSMWQPTGLDCEQWARVCKESKMAGGWLTTKHHGGFCLWDSEHTDYDVGSSPVKTDVVKAFTDAFRKAGLKIGLYYSVLDYHHGVENGSVTEDEIAFMKAQLTELLTNYGPIDYMNFDGWSTWPTTPTFDDVPYGELYRAVKAVQPDCLIVNHCYESNLAHADVPFADAAGRRYPYHPDYMRPTAASDFLQRGWWWDDNEDYGVGKSVDYVLKQLDSYNSHNSVYVLNVSPDPGGRLPDDAVARLAEVAKAWEKPADLAQAGGNWGFQYDVSANLAFMRTATQSSTAPFVRDKRAYPRAEIGIDGVLEGDGLMEQTSMTNEEDQPWWQVDLERNCSIESITLYNRTDAEQEKLRDYHVTVLDEGGTVVWRSYQASAPNRSVTYHTGGVNGRVVKVQLDGRGCLYLAEVVVTGEAERTGGSVEGRAARNPVIWADVPDVAVIRVGDTYYMSSTTMHMSPGLPIMKSKDLVNWNMLGYAYDRLVENDAMNLENGQSCYGRGSWASSLRYHKGTYYVSTFSSTSRRTHIYTTKDIEKGDWQETSFAPSLHDHSLFFDDDGRAYMLYGVGDLRLVELEPDLSGIKEGGFNDVVIRNASAVAGPNISLRAEGSQLRKIDGKYYVMNITWPRGGMRTQLIHRAEKITGPYEGRVVLQDQGVAQGCLIDTPEGKWYAVLFQDNGSVGRSPWLIPVRWEDGWPVLGVEGKAPMRLDIDDDVEGLGNIVASDEFSRQAGEALPLAWQWNHNPDDRHWSLNERPGFLRLTTGRVDTDLLRARNTLTQRTFGPESAATTAIDVTHMKDGDCAGLTVLQKRYGFVGVKMVGEAKSIVMVSAESESPVEMERVPLGQGVVFLKVDCDFKNRADTAVFYHSFDGKRWTAIGQSLQMAYTLPHFMGYRFGLFNFATKTAGGFVDFDFFRVGDAITRK